VANQVPLDNLVELPLAKVTDLVKKWCAAWMVVMVAVIVSGCSDSVPAPQPAVPARTLQPAFAGGPVLPPPDLTDDGPGSLIESKALEGTDVFDEISATAVRIKYRSTTGVAGAPSEVSGVVTVPPGPAPRGGWPILVFGHDVTGVANKCAPSLAPDLAGYASFMGVLLSRGYIVAMTDYQGLGVDGQPPHSLIDVATLGNNMIDAARAVRRVTDNASTRWGAFGYGEGGAAAWAAADRAGSYGGGLELVGAAALAPLADLSGLATEAEEGKLRPEQFKLQMLTVEDLALTSNLNRDDFRSGLAREQWDVLIDCAPPDPAQLKQFYSELTPANLQPSNPAAIAQLRTSLANAALPLNGGSGQAAPLLVVYATDDPVVLLDGVRGALRRACAAGAPIEAVTKVGDTLTTTDLTVQYAIDWLENRFGGAQLSNLCQGLT
jgi:alpha-beta hydrolase superfamily lysophospholipase